MSALPDLDELVDAAVTAAQMETGVPSAIAASRSGLGIQEVEETLDVELAVLDAGKSNLGRWTREEDEFVREHLGKMSLKEIGAAIGRSEAAVKVRFTRQGWAAPSKQPGELVAREVGWRLGKCGKSIKALIDTGRMPGRRLPGKRGIHVVPETAFYRWAIQPDNWIYFRHGRVRDEKLRCFLDVVRERWGDEWITTGQVARMHHLPGGSNDVTRHIYAGRLPAVKYQFWWVRRSIASSYLFTQGRGSGSSMEWPAAADAFLVLCSAVGVPQKAISELMKWPRWRPGYRLGLLRRTGMIGKVSERFELGVGQARSPLGQDNLFADWRRHANRFPGLQMAVQRLLEDLPLTTDDLRWLRGVLSAWARWHARDDPSRWALVGYLRSGGKDGERRIRTAWRQLQEWGADPLDLADL